MVRRAQVWDYGPKPGRLRDQEERIRRPRDWGTSGVGGDGEPEPGLERSRNENSGLEPGSGNGVGMKARNPGNRRQRLKLIDWGNLWMKTRPEAWGPRDRITGQGLGEI